jgi:sensor histidine kinase YesM
MHPILGHRQRLFLYLASWLAAGALLAGVLTMVVGWTPVRAAAEALPMALLYAFMCLSAWWVCRAAPLGRTPASRVLVMLLVAAIVSAGAWAVITAVWGRVLESVLAGALAGSPAVTAAEATRARAGASSVFATAGVPLYLFSAAVHYLIIAFESSRAAERVALEAQVIARDAELRALRAQLNPHFLFNSLNSINALVGSDPEGARRMCERLGDFLRRTLALAARSSVPLGEEVELVEQYLGIERVRFGSRLSSRVQVGDDAARCQVPPLVLQPLVENAVKHGVSNRVEGGEVRIEAVREGDLLRVRVTNPCDGDAPVRPGAGVGLDNVRRRLHTIAPRHARLTAGRVEDEYRVELFLPATDAEPAPAGAGAAVADGGGGT